MLEMIFQNFQENNNVINVTADEEFMRSENHIHHALSIQRRFLIIYKSYTDDFKIIMTDNYELFTVFYSHLSLIEKVNSVHHADFYQVYNNIVADLYI